MGLPTILAVAGTALNVVGALHSGASESANLEYQAAVSRYNADETTRAGEIEATNSGLRTRAQVGEIKASQAGSGVDVNSGSAADIQAAASQLGALDALTIRSNAARRAFGYRTDASNLDRGAQDVRVSALLKAASSLIGGASTAYGIGKQWADTGQGSASFYGAGSGPTSTGGGSEWNEPFDLSFSHG